MPKIEKHQPAGFYSELRTKLLRTVFNPYPPSLPYPLTSNEQRITSNVFSIPHLLYPAPVFLSYYIRHKMLGVKGIFSAGRESSTECRGMGFNESRIGRWKSGCRVSPQRGRAATKTSGFAQSYAPSRNPPGPPFLKGGLGGFQRIVTQREFAWQNVKSLQVGEAVKKGILLPKGLGMLGSGEPRERVNPSHSPVAFFQPRGLGTPELEIYQFLDARRERELSRLQHGAQILEEEH